MKPEVMIPVEAGVDPHCYHCGRDVSEYPMVFRGLPYCSDNCAKALGVHT